MKEQDLLRSLGVRDAIALVVGTVVGTGIFLKTAVLAQAAGSVFWVLAAWAAAGAVSLAGALTYAELGAMFPRAGGEYVYLREAYGPLPAFLYGWQRFWIGSPGSIAAYGVGAATFIGGVVPLSGPAARAVVAIALIALFSGLNCLTVAFGGRLQSVVTALKIILVFGLTVAIFVGSDPTASALESGDALVGAWPGWGKFGTAMLAAAWAYDGWNNMPMAAGEIRNPGRVLPQALGVGMVIVLVLYALSNLSYFYALPFSEVASSASNAFPNAPAVATRAAETVFGAVGASFLSVAFVLSALGAMNGSILTNARVPFAMARDDQFFRALGRVNARSHVPVVAVVVQALVASALALTATFDQLTDYVVFASWIFYGLTTAGVFVLRKRYPDRERPYRVPFYPVLPLLYLAVTVLLLGNTLVHAPLQSGIGLAFITAGVPAYLAFRWLRRVRSRKGRT